MRTRILFVAEAVSLAHVARPSVLANTLDTDEFEIHFASNGQFSICHTNDAFVHHRINSIAPQDFLRRLSAGSPLYTYGELAAYIDEDRALLDAVGAEIIVSDFRLSLAISARLSKIPLLNICNGHWSPYVVGERLRAPDLAMARLIGYPLFDPIFRLAWPWASKLHVAAANRLRRQYGLAPYRSLRELYCDGDISMYADTPALVRLSEAASSSHLFIGPLIWSPEMPLPPWWPEVAGRSEPPIYITLGSTGEVDLLPRIVDACRREGARCLVSTAGRGDFQASAPDVYTQAFLPGSQAAALSSLVICNGGSATAYQALAQGCPVLGICSNLDQVMTMQGVAAAGAGEFMRAGEATLSRLRESIRRMHSQRRYAERAQGIQASFASFDPNKLFPALVKDVRDRVGRKRQAPVLPLF